MVTGPFPPCRFLAWDNPHTPVKFQPISVSGSFVIHFYLFFLTVCYKWSFCFSISTTIFFLNFCNSFFFDFGNDVFSRCLQRRFSRFLQRFSFIDFCNNLFFLMSRSILFFERWDHEKGTQQRYIQGKPDVAGGGRLMLSVGALSRRA